MDKKKIQLENDEKIFISQEPGSLDFCFQFSLYLVKEKKI